MDTPSRRVAQGTFWGGLYLLLALAPLLLVRAGTLPEARGFWSELSVALAFIGLSMLGLQFAITARFRHVAAPYGIDVILQFHRQISLVAVSFIVLHPLILFTVDPATLGLLKVVDAPWRARFAVLALLLLLALVVVSVWRVPLGIPYEPWRITHGALAVATLAFSLAHTLGVGHYLDVAGKQWFWGTMATAAVLLLAHVRIVRPWMMTRRPWELVRVQEERGSSWTLTLRPVGHDGLRFKPGQFAWLTLDRSPFAIREHPFSFSSSAEEAGHVEMTVKALGDFTRHAGAFEPGTKAYLDGPYGAFTPDRFDAPGFVLVAGGVGITPIMSILRTLADREDKRPILLLHAAKTWESLTFRDDIDMLQQRLDLDVVRVLGEPPEGWEGETGRIDADLLERHMPHDAKARLHMLCGPPAMMEAVEDALVEHGVPPTHVVYERFNLV